MTASSIHQVETRLNDLRVVIAGHNLYRKVRELSSLLTNTAVAHNLTLISHIAGLLWLIHSMTQIYIKHAVTLNWERNWVNKQASGFVSKLLCILTNKQHVTPYPYIATHSVCLDVVVDIGASHLGMPHSIIFLIVSSKLGQHRCLCSQYTTCMVMIPGICIS